jgi:hypothetical protein
LQPSSVLGLSQYRQLLTPALHHLETLPNLGSDR